MFFVYDQATGALWSSGATVAPAEVLAARGLVVVEVPDGDVPNPWTWDAANRVPVARPADPVMLEPDEFLALFTPEEWAAGLASTDAQVRWLIDRLRLRRTPLSMASDTVVQGVALLAAQGIITGARATQILNTGTYMAVTRDDSGTLSSGGHTVGTGWTTLSTRTAAGVYQPGVDLTNMVNGDVVEILVEERVLAADGANVEVYRASFADVQTAKFALMPACMSVDNLVVKIRQLAGTARAYKWVVFKG